MSVVYIESFIHKTHYMQYSHTHTHTYMEYMDIDLHTRLTIWSIEHTYTHTYRV
jgi:hypothetical protein